VPLNIVEGYARQPVKAEPQFLTIAFGSLKESQYILEFAVDDKYFSRTEMLNAFELGDEVARLLWAKIQRFKGK
jgi:four helix bundle protein